MLPDSFHFFADLDSGSGVMCPGGDIARGTVLNIKFQNI